MKVRVLALDFDGTIAVDARLDDEVAGALREVRHAGIMTVLVSGRMLEAISASAAPVDREELRAHLRARYVLERDQPS